MAFFNQIFLIRYILISIQYILSTIHPTKYFLQYKIVFRFDPYHDI